MDKTIIAAGGAIIALGIGFAIAGELDRTLHSAYAMGGAFWIVIGGITIGFGFKVNRKRKQENNQRASAI